MRRRFLSVAVVIHAVACLVAVVSVGAGARFVALDEASSLPAPVSQPLAKPIDAAFLVNFQAESGSDPELRFADEVARDGFAAQEARLEGVSGDESNESIVR